jgi:serine/threonine-protein kinase HipA
MSRVLEVWFDGERVGTLTEAPGGLSFRYDPAWLARADAFPISASLPLEDTPGDERAARFFGNLLPEGSVRAALCRRLGLSEDNDFALLSALGRDCAGALILRPPGSDHGEEGSYRPLHPRRLSRFLKTGSVAAAAIDADVRLSLAGAQDKLAVRVDGARLFLPVHGAPSTHLLKLPSTEVAHLVPNELLLMRLAAAAGLPVPEVTLYDRGEVRALLVRRYDRVITHGQIRRLHQEDLCQALGVDRRRKYEAEGGPRFSEGYAHVRERSHRAVDDTRALLSWFSFCIAVGNRDNHAKNLSMVRHEDGRWILAPFYDLVCTLAYPRLSRGLAFSVGGAFDGGNLSRAHFVKEAERLEVRGIYLLDVVRSTCATVLSTLPEVMAQVADELRGAAALEAATRAVRKATRALERAVRT